MELKLNLDHDVKETQRNIEQMLKARTRSETSRIINNLFMSVAERNATYARVDGLSGMLYDILKVKVEEIINNQDQWMKYAEEYVEKNFKAALDKALEEAVTHQARRIAFNTKKEI